MFVRSVPLSFQPDFSELIQLISRDSLVWTHDSAYLLGFGTAARADLANNRSTPAPNPDSAGSSADSQTHSQTRFTAANRYWNALCNNAAIIDNVKTSGSGLITFGSFSFSPNSAVGSALIVPEVLVGKKNGMAWITQTWTADSAKPAVPKNNAGLLSLIHRSAEKHAKALSQNTHQSFTESVKSAESAGFEKILQVKIVPALKLSLPRRLKIGRNR
ncbi:hypothetical protein RQN30_09915 [Arcanobacterium hippocoleae]